MPVNIPLPIPLRLTRTDARLAGFVAISIAVHVLTALGAGPLDLSARQFGDPPGGRTALHATLAPGESARPAAPEPAPSTDQPDAAGDAATGRTAALDTAPAGTASGEGGLALPAPDKWYLASEVDVRAEPLTDIRLRYPENLRGEAVTGKVRVRLFIDEGGVVRKLQVAASEPRGLFDEAARLGWQDVRFTPARKNGAAVKSQKLLELTFEPGQL